MSRDRTGDMKVSSISDMIRKAQANISQIDELHSRTLGIISDDERIKRQLESITSETRGILTQIKDRIKKLEVSNLKQAKSGDIEVRKAQTSNLRQKFMETLQNYLREKTHQSTVPNIFIGNKHIGGNE
ncbi:13176_t:CDS:2 [Entrophospora sp. SA101]|nr:13176_t:CDS:2 [Entrophospora sp. SA101]